MAKSIPRDPALESTLAFLSEGYLFIAARRRRLRTDVFQTRLLLRPTICLSGREAAELFYDPERFQRAGAAPLRLQRTLFGVGGVQSLDGAEHQDRKRLLMGLLGPGRVKTLVASAGEIWRSNVAVWQRAREVVVFDEMARTLFDAVTRWCAVPMPPDERPERARQMVALFDGAGAVGWRHVRSRLARRKAERWMERLVEDLRAKRISAPEDSVFAGIAMHRDPAGNLLPARVAAVELLNVIRPTVAVAVYLVFAVLALHEHPEMKARCAESAEFRRWFAQEVRRFFPFFPVAAAKVWRDFEWRGYHFPSGTRTLLDLHGINHDPSLWPEPHLFRPERFAERREDAFDLVPQGGGDAFAGHRCAGEWLTLALLESALEFFTREVRYEVPLQDLTVSLNRTPALPRSRLILTGVRPPEIAVANSLHERA